MLSCKLFFDILQSQGINFYTGVPDSLLKGFCRYVSDNVPEKNHIIAANEGSAIALAIGTHLASGTISLVYLQNSGLGNVINPLASLADPEVYSIPMLLLVGWRGEPGSPDEPQHRKQGRITPDLLQTLEIPYAALPHGNDQLPDVLIEAVRYAKSNNGPFCLLASKNTFGDCAPQSFLPKQPMISREDAIRLVMQSFRGDEAVVATTGMASRELFEQRATTGRHHNADFLTVGGMGHASQIALGIANRNPRQEVYCLDGDGAAIMHMGSLATIGTRRCKNFKHVLINNGAHDSVGGQPTAGFSIDFPSIAKSCGYSWANSSSDVGHISELLSDLRVRPGPAMLEVIVRKGHRANLGRPTIEPTENKRNFMNFLNELSRV